MSSSSSIPAREPARKFSFLLDQEYQRKKDEAAAAAAAATNAYTPGFKDFALFAYFCFNVFLIGTPMLNSNAMVKVWKNSLTFRSECSGLDDLSSWCHGQAESAKISLLLYQSALAATGMMGGVLVDTFSASMCLLIAHIMFGGGAHFLRKASTSGIFLGCVLQGVSGELLLNSVLPICGLFGSYQSLMLLILTFCSDMSVLFYPLLLRFIASDSKLSSDHEEFYADLNSYLVYFSVGAALLGTFILPVDDCGNLMPVSAVKASVLEPINHVPRGLMNSSTGQRIPGLSTTRHDDDEIDLEIDLDDEDLDDPTLLLLHPEEPKPHVKRRKAPKSLWGLRFTRQLRTVQFFICLALFSICLIRNSFYLNNNQSLLEAAGDGGTLTEAFSWFLALGAVFGPLSWHINDNWPEMSALCLFGFLGLAVNILVAIESRSLQWLTLILFIANRSFLSSTVLTYIAGCFGFKHFPAMAVVIGILGSFINFLNLFVDQYTENHLDGNYHYANYLMIGLGVVVFLLILLQYLFPTLRDEGAESTEKIDELKRAVGAVTDATTAQSRRLTNGTPSAPEEVPQENQSEQRRFTTHPRSVVAPSNGSPATSDHSGNGTFPGAVVDEDGQWEDEVVEDSRTRL